MIVLPYYSTKHRFFQGVFGLFCIISHEFHSISMNTVSSFVGLKIPLLYIEGRGRDSSLVGRGIVSQLISSREELFPYLHQEHQRYQ